MEKNGKIGLPAMRRCLCTSSEPHADIEFSTQCKQIVLFGKERAGGVFSPTVRPGFLCKPQRAAMETSRASSTPLHPVVRPVFFVSRNITGEGCGDLM